MDSESITLPSLRHRYRCGTLTPSQLITLCLERIEQADPAIWISKCSTDLLLQRAAELEDMPIANLPLYGVPFAVKDNIDVAGMKTTAACPAFGYSPERNAFVVQQLLDAGAILMGKTNMDQFATGLVGVRSPHGVPGNVFNPEYIPGGSSSGSAVAVALGQVSFALGTDTAGSGRVPASFNNLVGFKPTRGRISCSGVVPACRSLDCVSIFALQLSDAKCIWQVASAYDAEDAYARPAKRPDKAIDLRSPRVAIAQEEQLNFFGDAAAEASYRVSLEVLRKAGAKLIEMDMSALFEAAKLLYGGPWVAERYIATTPIIEENSDAIDPVVRTIISGGSTPSAVDAFNAHYNLESLRKKAQLIWTDADFIILPTTGTIYTQSEVKVDPISLNTNLGYYTNFMNLLDFCGCAVPTAFREDGLPAGITLFGPAHSDEAVLTFSDAIHKKSGVGYGQRCQQPDGTMEGSAEEEFIDVFVCGAHMEGLPLNIQLIGVGAHYLREATTASEYEMYLLPATPTLPPRPGLVRSEKSSWPQQGEIWRIPIENFGDFMKKISYPLGIGQVTLNDGSQVYGFICDALVSEHTEDISQHGGWRAFQSTIA